jgi:hypothetical protein
MKKFVFLFAFALMLWLMFGCESEKSVQSDLDKLKIERETVRGEVTSLNGVAEQKNAEIVTLEAKAKELGMLAEGVTPKYILKLHLKQSHFSLSITKHIKDAANAIDFELPVDKDFYNSVEVGTPIIDEFRTGSFVLSGSFGDWEMTVKEKYIK